MKLHVPCPSFPPHLEEVSSQAQVALVGQPDRGPVPQQVLLNNLNSLQCREGVLMWVGVCVCGGGGVAGK